MKMTRSKLEQLTEKTLTSTKNPCEQCVRDAGLTKDQIDEVLLVGGMTRMPAVQDVVGKIFNKTPNRSINPDEAVAMGASI